MPSIKGAVVAMALGAVGALLVLKFVPGAKSFAGVAGTK